MQGKSLAFSIDIAKTLCRTTPDNLRSTEHRNVASGDNFATTSNEETLLSLLVDYRTPIIQSFPTKKKIHLCASK